LAKGPRVGAGSLSGDGCISSRGDVRTHQPDSAGIVFDSSELEYHLLLARDIKILKSKDYDELASRTAEVKRMLAGLLKKLKTVN
jgi:hypothetical protein